MKVKGTQRHNFDCHRVIDLLEKGKLSEDESKRILVEACQVINGLRNDLAAVLDTMDAEIKTRKFWLSHGIEAQKY